MTKNEIKKALENYGLTVHKKPVIVNINQWYYYHGETLNDCYKKPSVAKQRAYDYCVRLCNELNGKYFAIRGANCMTFSVHFIFKFDEKYYYCHITKSYNHCYPIEQLIR